MYGSATQFLIELTNNNIYMELGESFMSSIYVGLHTLYRDELKVVPIKKTQICTKLAIIID